MHFKKLLLIIGLSISSTGLVHTADEGWVDLKETTELDDIRINWTGVYPKPHEAVKIKLNNILREQDADSIYQELKKTGIENLDSTQGLMEVLAHYKDKGSVNTEVLKHDLIAKTNSLIREEKIKRPLSAPEGTGWVNIKTPSQSTKNGPPQSDKPSLWNYFGW